MQCGTAKGSTTLKFTSRLESKVTHSTEALILSKITGKLPIFACNPSKWSHLRGLQLADPSFNVPQDIDVLLGADIAWDIILSQRRRGGKNLPTAINSCLGWLVSGSINGSSSKVMIHHADVKLDQQLERFWDIESSPQQRTKSLEERDCESHFSSNIRQLATGRFSVSLPFKDPKISIGSSRDAAIRRLRSLERRLSSSEEYYQEYRDFMKQYEDLGHMERIPGSEIEVPLGSSYYIPHHFVLKLSSTTTKFRVVFDASAQSTNGRSLNDTLMVGPVIQDSLIAILTRFRTHPIAFTADIAKMYRQVFVDPKDQDFQRILWRKNQNKPMLDYRLKTVTYGTAPAPFLATRVLQELAQMHMEDLPLAAKAALSDFYVDDLMSGSSTLKEAEQTKCELLKLFQSGAMELRKWSSNSRELLQTLPADLRETKECLSIHVDQTVKTLGVFWNPVQDTFGFKISTVNFSQDTQMTKRKLLSDIAKIFDPLGWLGPIIIRAKILMQDLWKLQLGWDEILPKSIHNQWFQFRDNLQMIETISIKRCISPTGTSFRQLVGFCDASEKAYAAVVYLCAFDEDQRPTVSLISSKTRVAPTKQISLPRLELCGAVLLAQLIASLKEALKFPIGNIKAFTDSTVVLAWIQGHPTRWKTFVANRVTEIQQTLPAEVWAHVTGLENPADCASRGLDPSELRDFTLWWKGPHWLSTGHYPVYSTFLEVPEVEQEERKITIVAMSQSIHETALTRYSTLSALTRSTAWVLRYKAFLKAKANQRKGVTIKNILGPLSSTEIDAALIVWIQMAQQKAFPMEMERLSKQQPLSQSSRLRSLDPFIGSDGLLKVGGRLRNAPIPDSQRRPILLPQRHRLTELIISSEHLKCLHGGPQLVLASLTKRFWILSGRDTIRQVIRKCVICTRHRGELQQQFMGDLPAVRVTPSRPFQKCGVDYAGPFSLRAIPARSKVTFKAYLAVFVCFTTHAIHLEVVSSLSTPAFLASLKRFIARRGLPSDMYSDQGTNFIGAAKEIKEMKSLFHSKSHNQKVADQLCKNGVQWHFNPPGAPHMGGLWEAGVKSVKHHLHRILGPVRLTFEEFSTVSSQIEACLNSRPLTPLSADPNDLCALTPGHFLIGAPLLALPDTDLTMENQSRLSRWQLVEQLKQHFWHRWSREYVARLQQRPKWLKHRTNLKVGDLVLIKDDRYPPQQWKLGRILLLHPGADGIVRVVTLKTGEGELQRPIVKLCLLPVESPANSLTVEFSLPVISNQ